MNLHVCWSCAAVLNLFFSSEFSFPVGDARGRVALYRTTGPFLRSIALSYSPHRVQAKMFFIVEVSGNLAGRPNQPTGQLATSVYNLTLRALVLNSTLPLSKEVVLMFLFFHLFFIISVLFFCLFCFCPQHSFSDTSCTFGLSLLVRVSVDSFTLIRFLSTLLIWYYLWPQQ